MILGLVIIFSTSAQEVWVAPTGNDANSGTKEKPFRTLAAARDALRAASGKGEHKIILRGGNYLISKMIGFDKRDSGTPETPYIITSYRGERARLIGGVEIPGNAVRKTTDPDILNRILCPEARNRIFEIDLKALGIMDYGKIIPHGFGRAVRPAPMEITINGKRLRMAQWPNEDDTDKSGRGTGSKAKDIHYIKMPKPVFAGSIPRYGNYGNKGGIIPYDYERPDHYQGSDLFVAGYLGNGYSYNMIPVKNIDKQKKYIELADASRYGIAARPKWGYRGHTEYFFLNALEEIDQPGESYLDRKTGKIYFMFPKGVKNEGNLEIFASMMKKPIIAIKGASYFRIKNVTVECGRTIGIYMEGGGHNHIEGCTIRDLGTAGIMMGKGASIDSLEFRHKYTGTPTSGMMGSIKAYNYQNTAFFRNAGRHDRINNCDIYDIGVVGIYLGGGDRRTLTPGDNVVSNCRIYRTQNVERSFYGAITITGVGNRVEHCDIFDLFDIAILSLGNDIQIKFNDIHNCLQSASEKGLIYTGRNPSTFNLQVENNFIHDNGNPYGYTAIVHMDDYACGLVFKNNICYRDDRKFFINGGYLHTIENNIFINNCAWDSSRPVTYENGIRCGKSPEKWRKVLTGNSVISDVIRKRIFGVIDVRKPPYSTRYPKLAEIVNDPEKSKGTVIVRGNVCINSGAMTSQLPNENPGGGNVSNNWVDDNADIRKLNLGFADIDELHFRMQPNSDVFKKVPGFKMIPFERIGPIRKDSPAGRRDQ